jgi:hypothetical protein
MVIILLSLALILAKLDAENVNDFNCGNEAEAHEETEDAPDGADEGDLGNFLLRHVFGDVRVLDVDGQLDKVLPGVKEDLWPML